MYAVIVGAGEIGSHVARILIEDGHDVAIVEVDRDLAGRLDTSENALVVHGSGVNPAVLRRAGIESADLFLAVTSIDEVNLIACMTARKYGGERLRVLARVRHSQTIAGELALSAADLGLDALISPEQAVTAAAIENLRYTGSGELRELAGGRLLLVGLDMASDSPLVHESISELREDYPGDFVVVGVQGASGRIPRPGDRLRADERAFVLTTPGYLTELAILSGKPWYRVSRILIIGCGNTGLLLARELDQREYSLTIIESDDDRAHLVATHLPRALVLNGDGADPEFLRRQIGEREIDAVVVLLKDPEKSVLVGIFAATLGARKTIVRCDKPAYAQLATSQGVDALISPKRAMNDAIQRYVRRGRVEGTLQLGEEAVGIIQFRAPAAPASPGLFRLPLGECGLPKGALPAALLRGNDAFIDPARMILQPGDELLVVAHQDVLGRIERLFG